MVEEVEKIIKKYEKNTADIEKLQESKIKNEEELRELKEKEIPSEIEFEKELREKMEERKAKDIQEIQNSEDVFVGDMNQKGYTIELLEAEYQKRFEEKMKQHEEEVKEEIKKHKEKIRAKDRQIKQKDKKIETKKQEIEDMTSDENIRTITMGIEEIDKKIRTKNIELSKKKIEISEYHDRLNNDTAEKNTKTIYELYKEQDKIQNEIRSLEKDKEKYSEFLILLKELKYKLLHKEEKVEVVNDSKSKAEHVTVKEEKIEDNETRETENLTLEENEPQNTTINESGLDKQEESIELSEEMYTEIDADEFLNEYAKREHDYVRSYLDKEEIQQEDIKLEEDTKKDDEVVKVGEGKSQIIFTEQELEDFVGDEEITDLDNDEELSQIQKTAKLLKPNNLSNNSVKIYYNAKKDIYMIENINEGTEKIVNRKDLEKIDKKDLAEKLGKDIDNVDVNIYQLLLKYDEKYKTSKATEYIDMLSVQGKNKEQRQNDMKEHQIKIEYNLKGLYDKHEEELYEYKFNFSKEEREQLLNVANNAKKKGIATVNKGIKTTLLETWEKITSKTFGKIKQLATSRRITLPESKKERQEREERAKKREERLQECENELVELEKVVEEDEKIQKEFENAEGVTYSEKLVSVGEKFRDSYKVSENQEEYKEYLEQSEKTRNEMKKKRYDEQYEWKNGNYTTVKDEENSL